MATTTQRRGDTRRRVSSGPNQRDGASSSRGGSPSKASRTARASANGAGTRSASRSRTQSARSSKSAGSKTASSKTAPRTRGRSQAAKATRRGNGSPPKQMRERASETVGSAVGNVRNGAAGAGKSVGVPVATGTVGAALGIAGGVLLGRTIASRPRKVLGVKVPRKQAGFSEIARGVSDAGKQLGKLATEVRAARQKAEEIGKVLT